MGTIIFLLFIKLTTLKLSFSGVHFLTQSDYINIEEEIIS